MELLALLGGNIVLAPAMDQWAEWFGSLFGSHALTAVAIAKIIGINIILSGDNAVMPCIVRGKGRRYTWSIGKAPLDQVANVAKMMPRNYVTRDGFGITDAARAYFAPLIAGEAYPEYRRGLPVYVQLKNVPVQRKLKTRFEI